MKALEFAAANPTEDRTKDYFEYYKPEVREASDWSINIKLPEYSHLIGQYRCWRLG